MFVAWVDVVAEQNVGLRMMDSSSAREKKKYFNDILEEVIVIIIVLTAQRLGFDKVAMNEHNADEKCQVHSVPFPIPHTRGRESLTRSCTNQYRTA